MNKELRKFKKTTKQRKRRKAYEKEMNIMRNKGNGSKQVQKIYSSVSKPKPVNDIKKPSLWQRIKSFIYGKKTN